MAENEIVEQKKQTLSFSEQLRTDIMAVKGAVPEWLNIERFIQNSTALLNGNESLVNFAKTHGTAQIRSGMLRAAYLGLDFMSKEAYLVPRGNQIVFQMDYRGAEKLAKKYSIHPIKEIYANLVRQGDEFKYWVDDEGQHLVHNELSFNDNAIIGAYAVCQFEDGTQTIDRMSKAELDKSRSKSIAKNSMAWADFAGEMYKKTVLHRLCKHIEIEFDNADMTKAWNEDESLEITEETESAIDVEEDVVDVEENPVEIVEVE